MDDRSGELVNRGTKDGVRMGMEFVATRDGRPVGRVVVVAVYSTDAEAQSPSGILICGQKIGLWPSSPNPDFATNVTLRSTPMAISCAAVPADLAESVAEAVATAGSTVAPVHPAGEVGEETGGRRERPGCGRLLVHSEWLATGLP